MDNITKKITEETIGSVTEIGFATLAAAAGFPQLIFASPLAKGLVLGLIQNCFNDCQQRTLSTAEMRKLSQEYEVALQTFKELAEKDGVTAWELNIEQAHIDNAFEVAEHVTLEGIRQSERKKVDILGRFYGRTLYKQNADWQDMHQIITMVGSLTMRQLVVLRLIVEGFNGFDSNMFISNPSACVEINRLRDYGIWKTTGIAFGIDESNYIPLKFLHPTDFAVHVYETLMLGKIPYETIQETVKSLHLMSQGKQQDILTKEQYDTDITSMYDENGNTRIDGGNAQNNEMDEDKSQAMFDFVRGK